MMFVNFHSRRLLNKEKKSMLTSEIYDPGNGRDHNE
jgi:hypothetical protein